MTTPRGISTAATLDHAQEAKAAVQLQRGSIRRASRARPAWTATPRGHSPASMTGQEPETTAARAHHPSGPSAIRRYRPLQRPAWPTAHPLGRVAHPSSTRAPSSSCVDHGRTCSPQWFHQTRDQPPSEWTPRNGQDPYRGHMERTHEKQASHAQPPHLGVGGVSSALTLVRAHQLEITGARRDRATGTSTMLRRNASESVSVYAWQTEHRPTAAPQCGVLTTCAGVGCASRDATARHRTSPTQTEMCDD